MEPYQIKLAGLLGLVALGLVVTDAAPSMDATASIETKQPSPAAPVPAKNRNRPAASHGQYEPSVDQPDKPDFDQLSGKAEAGADMTAEERREFTRQVASRLDHPDAGYSPETNSPD